VLKWRRQELRKAFQTRAPATEKARRPTVGSLTAGGRSSEVEDRSLCRVGMLATDVTVEKVINVYRNWCNQTLWSLFSQFPNCRPNPTAVVVS